MSLELHLEVRIQPEVEQHKPAEQEMALIESILPELLRLMQQLDTSDED